MTYGRLIPVPSVAGWHFTHNQRPGAISAQLGALGLWQMPGYHACLIGEGQLVIGLSVPLDHPHAHAIRAILAPMDIDPL